MGNFAEAYLQQLWNARNHGESEMREFQYLVARVENGHRRIVAGPETISAKSVAQVRFLAGIAYCQAVQPESPEDLNDLDKLEVVVRPFCDC